MGRGLLLAGAGLGLLGAATVAARWWAGEELTRVLTAREVRWAHRSDRFTEIQLEGLRLPGVAVDRARVDLVSRTVHLSGVDVDARVLLASGTGSGAPGGGGAGSSPSITVAATGVDLRWGDTPLVQGLAGPLLPATRLASDDARLVREGETTTLTVARALDTPHLQGAATAELSCLGRDCRVSVAVDEAVVSHPLLAPAPLPPHPLVIQLETVPPAGPGAALALQGEARLGPVSATVGATVQDGAADVVFDTEDVALDDAVALFGPLVPEASGAILGGTLGLSGRYAWPAGDWALQPRADRLSAEAVLPPVELRGGPFAWTAPTAGGGTALRRAGEGVPGWVPLREAGLFPDAVIAAEDSAFATHRGYDPAAVQAALDRMATEPDGLLRGGSTLTQQLAKNLFLDRSDRSLARKLRELLLALELEQTLPKRRILELYINVVELGPGLVGVGEAADAYFLKRPARLTPREAAFLAAILPAPTRWGGRAWRTGRVPTARVTATLQNMADGGALSPDAAAAAQRAPLRFVPPP